MRTFDAVEGIDDDVTFAGTWVRRNGVWRQWEDRTFAGAEPSVHIPDTFDQIFARVTQGIPIQVLKATAWEESRYNPKAESKGKDGHVIARGLGQIIEATRETFNGLNHYSFKTEDLYDPEKNAMVMAWLYRYIANLFKTRTKTQQENWDDPDYVGNVMLAYGAGAGTAKHSIVSIIQAMEDSGVPKNQINVDTIRQAAMKAFPSIAIYNNGAGMLSDPALINNIKAKLKNYLELRNAPAHVVAEAIAAPAPQAPPAQEPPKGQTLWEAKQAAPKARRSFLSFVEDHPIATGVAVTGFFWGLSQLVGSAQNRRERQLLEAIEREAA